jgi:hypothetical protein
MTDGAGGSSPKPRKSRESAELERKATPWPSFDLAAFARTTEQMLREESEPSASAFPATLQRQMAELAARAHVLNAQLRKGALSREEAAHALRSELRGLEAEATRREIVPLAAMLAALRETTDEIGGIAQIPPPSIDVLVLTDDIEARTRVAVAVASLGYTARAASSVVELARLSAASPPSAILVGGSQVGRGAPGELLPLLRVAAGRDDVRILVFADGPGPRAREALEAAGVDCAFSAAHDVEVIMGQIAELLFDMA